MDNELKKILCEIEEIIANIGNYDIGKLKLSEQGRKELTELFKQKIIIANTINKKSKLKLAS